MCCSFRSALPVMSHSDRQTLAAAETSTLFLPLSWLFFHSVQVACTQAPQYTVRTKKRTAAPRAQQSHIFLSAASIFAPVYHKFWSLGGPETLYCTLFCRKDLSFIAVGYKRLFPSSFASPGKFDGCDCYQGALLGKSRSWSAFSLILSLFFLAMAWS